MLRTMEKKFDLFAQKPQIAHQSDDPNGSIYGRST